MSQRKDQINLIISKSKSRVQWAFNYIKEQPNFRQQVLPKMADLYKFFVEQIMVNIHPQFWKKHHRVFELQKQQMQGRQLGIARNIIRAIDDYKQYLIQLLQKSNQKKQEEEQQKNKTPAQRGVFQKKEEQQQQTQEQNTDIDKQIEQASEDDTREYGHLYGNVKRKRYYGNYYQQYGQAKKKKKISSKPKKIDYYSKSKQSRKHKSPWVKSY